jgi:hypothetical protein
MRKFNVHFPPIEPIESIIPPNIATTNTNAGAPAPSATTADRDKKPVRPQPIPNVILQDQAPIDVSGCWQTMGEPQMDCDMRLAREMR